jgi:hypothetical protein
MFEFANGTIVGPADIVHVLKDEVKEVAVELYDDDYSLISTVAVNGLGLLKKINGINISEYTDGMKYIANAGCRRPDDGFAWFSLQLEGDESCDESCKEGYQCLIRKTKLPTNPPVMRLMECVKKSNNGESESGTTSATVFDDLDKFISEKFVGSSVWKNDEGNFNTARLVSDSVAGVVLGTVGGVITSHIIKKNQIKNGFDDLKCTIGGQTVASYGDEFRVGVK